MKLLPIEELSDALWAQAHTVFYSLALHRQMNTSAQVPAEVPTLPVFYNQIMDAVEAGTFKAWAIIDENNDYLGHVILEWSSGVAELGIVIADPDRWHHGIGARAGMKAIWHVFEERNEEWVWASINSRDPHLKSMAERFGFKPFAHLWILSREAWEAGYKAKVERILARSN